MSELFRDLSHALSEVIKNTPVLKDKFTDEDEAEYEKMQRYIDYKTSVDWLKKNKDERKSIAERSNHKFTLMAIGKCPKLNEKQLQIASRILDNSTDIKLFDLDNLQ